MVEPNCESHDQSDGEESTEANSVDAQGSTEQELSVGEASDCNKEPDPVTLFVMRTQSVTETLASLVRTLSKTVTLLLAEDQIDEGRTNMKKAVKDLMQNQTRNSAAVVTHVKSLEDTITAQSQEIDCLRMEREALNNKIQILQEMADHTQHSVSVTACNTDAGGNDFSTSSPRLNTVQHKLGTPSKNSRSVPFEITVESVKEERLEV